MQTVAPEKSLSKLLAFGMFFTTIFLISGSVTDPVNAPKLLSLGVFSCSGFALMISTDLRKRILIKSPVYIGLVIFLISMVSATIYSKSPISQNIYGSFGRNNGLICYLFLALLLLAYANIRRVANLELLVRALLFSGFLNLAYCAWVIAFGDFVGWFNPYRGILGTFGNPDFISAYLGIFFAVCISMAANSASNLIFRVSMLIVLPLTFFEILKSHAIQGRVVAVLGASVVGFFYIRSRFNRIWVAAYTFLCMTLGSFALAGALQHGPLVKYIYKVSVSLRGQYWLAAWNTGSAHPVTGVGMDSFGDWYRRSRDTKAITLPGVNTIVNTAHNVWLDMFAFGGWPLFLSYLLILLLTVIAIIKIARRDRTYQPTFVALTTAWVGYQAQSIISINQIGLAIWGWALSGALISYEIATREKTSVTEVATNSKNRRKRANQENQQIVGVLSMTGGALIGLLIALPPLTADAKLRSAQVAKSLPALEQTMKIDYFNPATINKFLNNIQILEASNLPELAHKYALDAVKWNPESFEIWKTLYMVKNSTSQEKATALQHMKRLDPLNPDVTSIK